MSTLLRRLLAALFGLGVGEVDPDAEVPIEAQGEGEEGAETEGEPEGEGLEDVIEGAAEGETPAARSRQAEIEMVAEAAARRVVGDRQPPAPQPNQEAQTRQREDGELDALRRAGADARQIAEKEWEIQTNRTLRQSDQKSNMALFQAAEFNDKGEFRELATDPVQGPIYRAYKDRVEKELAELRKSGMNVPRTTLMYYLYGRDRAQGKVKLKAKAPKKEGIEALPANVRRIDRGRLPGVGARGDVSARGKPTERQQLEKRLMNADGTYKCI